MPSPRLDPGIRPALRALNGIPGARTRASCQGKAAPGERTSHADLAYVLFRSPVPLALEEHFLAALADVARVEPVAAYSLWPERNQEFCRRLADAAEAHAKQRSERVAREWRIPVKSLLSAVEATLSHESEASLEWCLDCGELSRDPAHAGSCRTATLVEGGGGQRLALFATFLASDSHPPDQRLREREGDRAVLERLLRGDFGRAARKRWSRFISRAAKRALAGEIRGAVAEARRGGTRLDVFVDRGSVVFGLENPVASAGSLRKTARATHGDSRR